MATNFKSYNDYNSYNNYSNDFTDNPYRPNKGGVNEDVLELMRQDGRRRDEMNVEADRSMLNRAFSPLLTANYMSAGFSRGFVNDEFTPLEGMVEGLKAGNPFGKGNPEGEHTYSRWLEDLGWETKGEGFELEGMGGRVARGVTGFVLDVALDPATYLTGGASALVKGTGRTSKVADDMAKITAKAPDQAYENTMYRMNDKYFSKPDDIAKKVNKDLVGRLATKNSEKIAKATDGATHMTDDLAKVIIENNKYSRGLKVEPEEVAREATELANKFNKLKGIRDVNNPKPITYGMANLPFMGNKKWAQKMTAHVSDGQRVRQFSDKIGIANQYSKLRNGVYGSKIGKLFSTTSPLKKLADEDPSKLYDFMKFVDFTHGNKYDKTQADRLVRDRAKSMNFTPAETDQIIKNLEDKTIWSKVKDNIKFSETKKGKEVADAMSEAIPKYEDKLTGLYKARDSLDDLRKATDDGLIQSDDVIKQLEREYQSELTDINISAISDQETQSGIIHAINQERIRLTDEIALQENIAMKNAPPTSESISKLYDQAKKETEINTNYETQRQALKKSKLDKDVQDSVERSRVDQVQNLNHTIDDEMLQMGLERPGRAKNRELIEKLGKYIDGDESLISQSVSGKALDDLVNMVKREEPPAEIRKFIEKNDGIYNPHAKEVWSYIASKYGYKDWQKEYWEPIEKFANKVNKGEGLTAKEQQEWLRLTQLRAMRRSDYEQLYKGMSYEEFQKMRKSEANAEMIQDLNRSIDLDNEVRRSTFYDNDRARVDHASGVDRRHADQVGKTNVDIENLVNDESKATMFSDIMLDFVNAQSKLAGKNLNANPNLKKSVLTPQAFDHISDVTDSLETLLKKNFNKPYEELSRAQQTYARSLAEKSVKQGQAKVSKELEQAKKLASDEMQRRAELARFEAIVDETREGSTIIFNDGKRPRSARVTGVRNTEGGLVFDATVRGEKHQVFARDVIDVPANIKNKTPEQLITDTPMIERLLKQHEDTVRLLEQEKDRLAKIQTLKSTNQRQSMDKFSRKIANQREKIRDMEGLNQDYNKRIRNLDSEAETLSKRISEFEEAVNDGEALEAWVRMHSQSDVELIKDPGRYSHIKKTKMDSDKMGHAGKDGIAVNENIDKQQFFSALKTRAEKLYGGKYSYDDMKEIVDTPEKMQRFVAEHELSHFKNEDWMKTGRKVGDLDDPATASIEGRADMDAINMVKNIDVDEILRYENITKSAKIAFDDIDQSQKVKEWTIALRKEFDKMGADEVSVGKLTEAQFEALVGQYLPRTVTDEGKRFFRETVESTHGKKRTIPLTEDLGYGAKFNPFSKSRTIEGKGIKEINEHFRDKLKGKNLFSENVADIYLTRALKNNELMYDNKYMNEMMETFGKPVGAKGVEEGYTAVANYGQLRNKVSSIVNHEIRKAEKKGLTPNKQTYDEYTDKVLDQLGLNRKMLEDFKTPMVELSEDQLQKLRPHGIVRQVNDAIALKANQARKMQIERDQSDFLQLYDRFLHFMKLNQTTVIPAFHTRNKMSNMFLNWLGTGTDAINKDFQIASNVLAKNRGDSTKIKDIIQNKKFGHKQLSRPVDIPNAHPDVAKHLSSGQMTWEDLYDQALRSGAIDEGFFAQDIGAGAQTKGMISSRTGLKSKYDPTDTENFILYDKGKQVGTIVENGDRLTHFVSQVKKGKSFKEASESSRKYLFDYSDLTAFEQSKMKRILPYYTWLRKNGRLQVSELLEQPEKFRDVAKSMNAVEGMTDEDDQLNPGFVSRFAEDWVRTPFSSTEDITDEDGNVIGQKTKPILFSPNLPFMDITRLPDPTNPIQSARELFAQTAPQIKVPLELALNYNAFFDNEIVREGDSKVGAGASHMSNQFAISNVIKGMFEKEGTDRVLHGLNSVSGLKFLAYDYEMSKNMKIAEMMDDANQDEKNVFGKVAEIPGNMLGGIMGLLREAGETGYDATRDKISHALGNTREGLIYGMENMVGQVPDSPEDYRGALRPLSNYAYDQLPDEEKAKYKPPTDSEAHALNHKAIELSEQAYEETGNLKQFVWSFIDRMDTSDDGTTEEIGHVTRVIDGDTAMIDIGGNEQSVRFLLVDTPETVHPNYDEPMPYGQESSDFVTNRIESQDIRVHLYPEKDHYGRSLAYLELDNGTDLNKEIIEEGLGRVSHTYKDFPDNKVQYDRTDEYMDAQIEASDQQKGIWGIEGYGGDPTRDMGFDTQSDKARNAINRFMSGGGN